MSVMPKPPMDPPRPPDEQDPILETVRLLNERRDRLAAAMTALDDAIERLQAVHTGAIPSGERPRSGPYRYAGLGIIEAMELYLARKNSAASREELRTEVMEGGATVGQDPRYAAGNVNKSIKYNLEADPPRLMEVNGLIGLPGWAAEKF